MAYKVGDTVVYPRHGAARIVAIGDHELKGVTRRYIKMQIIDDPSGNGLTIEIPEKNLKKVGVRDIVDAKAVSKVFEILRTPIEEEKTNWSRRFKLNQERVDSGDVNKIAEVVRDLAQRDDLDHGLSAGEKRMLVRARSILCSEIALSEKITEEQAQHLLDVNLGYAQPTADDLKHHAKAPKEKASETLNRVEAERKAARRKARPSKKKAATKEETKAVREKIEKASAARSQKKD